MKKLRGKCKDCIGCNKLEEFGFKGTNYCNRYIKGTNEEKENCRWIILLAIFCMVIIIIMLGYFYIRYNRLCGG